jgi:LPXTG-site transpeptidase (sortase) family protein
VDAELVGEPRPAFRIIGSVLAMISILSLSLLAQLAILGGLAHDRDQDKAFRELRNSLANSIAPVGPTDEAGHVLEADTPVAILEIPALGVSEVVLEGTTSTVLMSGPGHRRDTPLPGQSGTSVVFGRRGAYGAPFERVRELRPKDEIVVTTGQGRHTFSVLSVRRAGDPLPPALTKGAGRITLVTADGPAFKPSGVLRVDADLTSQAQPTPAQIPARALPENEAAMAGDTSELIPLMLWGLLLVTAALGTVWVRHRVGRWQAWVIGVPVLVVLGGAAIDSVAALLPNLL